MGCRPTWTSTMPPPGARLARCRNARWQAGAGRWTFRILRVVNGRSVAVPSEPGLSRAETRSRGDIRSTTVAVVLLSANSAAPRERNPVQASCLALLRAWVDGEIHFATELLC